ncbi:MAG: hypothetical protein ABIS18_11925 [Actinomycetota bacterium]
MEDVVVARIKEAAAGLSFEADIASFRAQLATRSSPASVQGPKTFRWKRTVVAGVLLAASLTGTALARSGPGDALFDLKRTGENLWASSALSATTKAMRHLDLAEERTSQSERIAVGDLRSDLLKDARAQIIQARLLAPDSDRHTQILARADQIEERIDALDLSKSSRATGESEADDRSSSEDTPREHPSSDDERAKEPDDGHSGSSGGSSSPTPSPSHSEEPVSGHSGSGSGEPPSDNSSLPGD